jgi:hypothetical protein
MGRLEAKTLGTLRVDVGAEEAVERGLVAGGQWTYKAKGKTVNVKLTPEVMPMFRAASQQYRKLKSLLNRLERLSQTVLRHQAQRAQSAHRPLTPPDDGSLHSNSLIPRVLANPRGVTWRNTSACRLPTPRDLKITHRWGNFAGLCSPPHTR